MGELAPQLEESPALYRGLRPEALAVAGYLGRLVRSLAGGGRLTVTSTVRDRPYQRLLARGERGSARAYSLHTTGYAFDVLRRYASGGQAEAFQFALGRLQALDLIAWVRERQSIRVTASREAGVLGP
jgi:hypothetical protein